MYRVGKFTSLGMGSRTVSHHSVFYTMLHNTTTWKLLVGNTFCKSLEKPKADLKLRKSKPMSQTGGPDA